MAQEEHIERPELVQGVGSEDGSTTLLWRAAVGRRLVLGLDLDGVCTDFYGGLRPIAAEWLAVREEKLIEDVSYGLPEWGIEDSRGGFEAFFRFAVTQRSLFQRLRPVPNACTVLRRLAREHDVLVRIISQRMCANHLHQEVVRQTVAWLDSYDFPYSDLCFVQNKVDVDADIYIEDSPVCIQELRAAGRNVVVFANSTNRGVAGPRASSWLEVERLVMDEVMRKVTGRSSEPTTVEQYSH